MRKKTNISNNKSLTDEDIEEAKSSLMDFVKSDVRSEIELAIERETKECAQEIQKWIESPSETAPTNIRGMSADYYNKANQIMSFINGKQLQRAQKLNAYASAVEDYIMKRFITEADSLSFRDCVEYSKMLAKGSEDILETARKYNYQIKDLETLTPEANEFVALASTLSPEMLSKLQGQMKKILFGEKPIEQEKEGKENQNETTNDENMDKSTKTIDNL